MQTVQAREALDRRGRSITTFIVYDASAKLQQMTEGEHLELLTDDLEPIRADIEAWCRATGQILVRSELTQEGRRFLIEKRSRRPRDTSMAMIVSSDVLDELLSPLGFALGAALEGIEVHLYLQGPAVRVLARGYRPRLRGWSRPFSRFAAAGLSKAGHIPAQDKLRQLKDLGAHLYVCGGSAEHFKVSKEEMIFDDLPFIAYFTFMSVMETADIHLYV